MITLGRVPREDLEAFPACRKFDEVIGKMTGVVGHQYGIVATNDASPSPEPFATALVRVAIEGSDRLLGEGQKFVVLTRFQEFGRMLLLDLVSLDQAMHRDIARAYLKAWGNEDLQADQSTEALWSQPYMIVGGFAHSREDITRFEGSSGDFGNMLFGAQASDLATFLLAYASSETQSSRELGGGQVVHAIMAHMIAHQQQPDFYEKTYDLLLQLIGAGSVYAQHLGGLIHMKADARYAAEGGSLLKILVEEISGGFSSYAMVSGTQHMQARRNAALK